MRCLEGKETEGNPIMCANRTEFRACVFELAKLLLYIPEKRNLAARAAGGNGFQSRWRCSVLKGLEM